MFDKKTVCCFLVTILITGVPTSYAQIITQNISYSTVQLTLAPSHIEADGNVHSIGYINLVNKNGIPVVPYNEVKIKLKSDDPTIASVPSEVVLGSNQNYVVFDIKVGEINGKTTISATFNEQTVYETLIIGESNLNLPDKVGLVLHLPTKEMHVNSEMPFSIFLQNSIGEVVQSPFDVNISFEYEDPLINVVPEQLTIKKGEYYSWGIIKTTDKVGNAFLKAKQTELNLNAAENIKISSSLPSALEVNIFPKIIPKEVERNVDIIVSLVDSDGLPTLAKEDVKLKFFSDNVNVGNSIDERMKESIFNGVIKKGTFSYHFRQKLTLNNTPEEIIIGASTAGLGVASDCFVVREPLTFDNPLAGNKTMHVFTLDKIPSHSKTVAVYQIGALIETSKTEEEKSTCIDFEMFDIITEESGTSGTDSEKSVEFRPILSNENLVAMKSFDKVNLVSSDNLLVKIEDFGKIDSGHSYGTAIIATGKETGEVLVSTTIKGVGSASKLTEVINTLKHDSAILFSPTGSGVIHFDKNGNFDLFVIALDGKQRPTYVEDEARYLITPINDLVEIEKNRTFVHAKFHSKSFNSIEDDVVKISAVPVGVSADESLLAEISLEKQPSAKFQLIIPYQEFDSQSEKPYDAIVQLVDFRDNPVKTKNPITVKMDSNDSEIIKIPRFLEIPEGTSYTKFTIQPTNRQGDVTLSAQADGIISAETTLTAKSYLTKMSISTGPVAEPLPVGETIELKLYVDNEFAQPVEGASLSIVSESTKIVPTNIKTEKDGSAKISFIPNNGPTVSFQIFATAEGYVDEQKTLEFSVNSPQIAPINTLDVGLPEWTAYVAIAAVLVIVGMVVFFLKKPKPTIEENEEIFEDEI